MRRDKRLLLLRYTGEAIEAQKERIALLERVVLDCAITMSTLQYQPDGPVAGLLARIAALNIREANGSKSKTGQA